MNDTPQYIQQKQFEIILSKALPFIEFGMDLVFGKIW